MASVSSLKPKNHASSVAKIALVLVALSKVVAEPCQYKIKLCRPDGDGLGHGNIDPSTQNEIPRIIAGARSGSASELTSLGQIRVHIGMGSAKQRLHKGFEVWGAVFENRADVVGEEVAAISLHSAPSWAGAIRRRRESKGL